VGVGKTPAVAYQRQHNSTCHLRLCAAATLGLQENPDLGGKGFLHCLIFIRRDAFHVFLYCRCRNMGLRRAGHWSGFAGVGVVPVAFLAALSHAEVCALECGAWNRADLWNTLTWNLAIEQPTGTNTISGRCQQG